LQAEDLDRDVEANIKLLALHTAPFGDEEVAEFMYEDDKAETSCNAADLPCSVAECLHTEGD
jgi:hypothetical protein